MTRWKRASILISIPDLFSIFISPARAFASLERMYCYLKLQVLDFASDKFTFFPERRGEKPEMRRKITG